MEGSPLMIIRRQWWFLRHVEVWRHGRQLSEEVTFIVQQVLGRRWRLWRAGC